MPRLTRQLIDLILPLITALVIPLSCTPDPVPPGSPPPVEAGVCKEPRPQMCMEIYMPVCGFTKDGQAKTYPNSCHACAKDEVVRYEPGACKTN